MIYCKTKIETGYVDVSLDRDQSYKLMTGLNKALSHVDIKEREIFGKIIGAIYESACTWREEHV
jgi:hypothetical protein